MAKKIVLSMIRLFHCIINYSICNKIVTYWRSVYSHWIQYEFGKVGKDVYIGKMYFLKGAKYISLDNNVCIGERCIIEVYDSYQDQPISPILTIGANSHLGDDGHITCISKIQIGNNVLMGRKVFITDNSHGTSDRVLLDIAPNKRPLVSKGTVVIEDNVWIGEMVCIMPGIRIGKSSIIGANAVVTKDVPSYCVVGGNPAKVIKNLDS